jgi:hypothetical protein
MLVKKKKKKRKKEKRLKIQCLTCFALYIEISHDKAQSIIDEITRAYDVAEAGRCFIL